VFSNTKCTPKILPQTFLYKYTTPNDPLTDYSFVTNLYLPPDPHSHLCASFAHKGQSVLSRGANVVERGLEAVIARRAQALHCPPSVCAQCTADAPRRAHQSELHCYVLISTSPDASYFDCTPDGYASFSGSPGDCVIAGSQISGGLPVVEELKQWHGIFRLSLVATNLGIGCKRKSLNHSLVCCLFSVHRKWWACGL